MAVCMLLVLLVHIAASNPVYPDCMPECIGGINPAYLHLPLLHENSSWYRLNCSCKICHIQGYVQRFPYSSPDFKCWTNCSVRPTSCDDHGQSRVAVVSNCSCAPRPTEAYRTTPSIPLEITLEDRLSNLTTGFLVEPTTAHVGRIGPSRKPRYELIIVPTLIGAVVLISIIVALCKWKHGRGGRMLSWVESLEMIEKRKVGK